MREARLEVVSIQALGDPLLLVGGEIAQVDEDEAVDHEGSHREEAGDDVGPADGGPGRAGGSRGHGALHGDLPSTLVKAATRVHD